jgi:hypothetical protein
VQTLEVDFAGDPLPWRPPELGSGWGLEKIQSVSQTRSKLRREEVSDSISKSLTHVVYKMDYQQMMMTMIMMIYQICLIISDE